MRKRGRFFATGDSTTRLFKTATLLPAALAISRPASAGMTFAVGVASQSGTIDGDTQWTLGSPDDRFVYGQSDFFVQLGADATLTLDMGALSSSEGVLSIFTVDNELAGSAKVDIIADGSVFQLLRASLSDANGVISLPPPPHTFPFVDIAVAMPFRYVRFTGLPDGESFDLNALGFSAAAVPEPGALPLLGTGASAFLVFARRRNARGRGDR